jgi:transcriptional regulator with GAF, ATPase, and Fis domain
MLNLVLKDVLQAIRESSGFQSVAIRLQENSDYPYFQHIGFPEIFVRKEYTLNVKDKQGNFVLDADGAPLVECMCGNVLKKRVNPNYEYFTKEGAFWTNSTTQLLENLTEKEKQEIGRTRNTCHNYGYETVALIPIHAADQIIGLIQMNDPRENMLTLEKIEQYQLLADQAGSIITDILEFYEKLHTSTQKSRIECP